MTISASAMTAHGSSPAMKGYEVVTKPVTESSLHLP